MSLHQHWKFLLGLTVASGLGIFLAGPHYTEAQSATSVADFRAAFDYGDRGRYLLAGGFDMVFSVAYSLLAVAVIWPRAAVRLGNLRKASVVLICVGGVFDLVENAVVIANVRAYRTLSETNVDLMHTVGLIKWAGLIGGLLVLLVWFVGSRLGSSRGESDG